MNYEEFWKLNSDSCTELDTVGASPHEIALARCDCLLGRYLKWKLENHTKSDRAQRAALVFTAVTPVLVLLPWEYVNILGAVTAAAAAIATGLLAIHGWRDNYIRYGYVWHALQSEKVLYLTRGSSEYRSDDDKVIARHFAWRIEQIVQGEVRDWRALMQRDDAKPDNQGQSGNQGQSENRQLQESPKAECTEESAVVNQLIV